MHYELKGKIEVVSRAKVDSKDALSLAYTPGVAQPCLEIQKDINKSYELTRRWNTVAVVTDGTAVLGLGDIGPEAGMPVMEGKCVLFKEFGDVDDNPLCVRSKDVDEIVQTVRLLAGSFGGVNLEDISAPRCFEIEKKLKECCDIPIFHDDQHQYDRANEKNWYFEKQYIQLEKGYTTLNTIFNAKVKLPFNITYQFNIAPRFQFFYDRYFTSAERPNSNPNDRGTNREQAKRFNWSLNNTITWDQTFANRHHVILTFVQEAEERQYWSDRIEARNILPSDALGFHNTQNGDKSVSSFRTDDNHQTADALMARAFYSYDDRYMVTGTIRRDGYSAFGANNPYAWFPSGGIAWSFTNEDFFQKYTHIMNSGKLRVSYGKNGNRSLENPYEALANLYPGGGKMQGYITSSGDLYLMRYLMAQRMKNPNLQWEKTQSWNLALDFGFLNDRITGTLEYYQMSTKDMIMRQPLSNFTGFENITTNLGQVNNSGFEVALNTLNIDKKNFQWSSSFSLSYNKNRIKHLFGDRQDIVDANGTVVGSREADYVAAGWFIDKPISAIWDYKVTGIWQKDEVEEAKKYGQVPGDPKVWNNPANDQYDADGNLVKVIYNNDDKVFQGQTAAPVTWALRNDFTLWKDLTLSVNIYSRMGHKSLESMYLNNDDDGGGMTYRLVNKNAKEYWTVDNPTNKYARIEAQGPEGAKGARRLYNRSFIRLENISVGYTLPRAWTEKIQIDRVKVYGSVRRSARI